ncbi:hypothetical protein T07_4353, partial [Trichinella nelsoni]
LRMEPRRRRGWSSKDRMEISVLGRSEAAWIGSVDYGELTSGGEPLAVRASRWQVAAWERLPSSGSARRSDRGRWTYQTSRRRRLSPRW